MIATPLKKRTTAKENFVLLLRAIGVIDRHYQPISNIHHRVDAQLVRQELVSQPINPKSGVNV